MLVIFELSRRGLPSYRKKLHIKEAHMHWIEKIKGLYPVLRQIPFEN